MTNLFTSPTRSLRHLLIAASVMTLAACATATPYQAASEPGAYDGFSEQFIENDRARISFGGNSLTDRETVENYLLYRSAETAIERGYETFTLQEQNLDEDRKIRVSSTGFNNDPFFRYSFFHQGFGWSRGVPFSRFGGFRSRRGFGRRGFGRSAFGFGGRGFGGDPFFNDFNVREITKYRATAEVKFGSNFSSEDEHTYNAREVLDNLSSTITFAEPDES